MIKIAILICNNISVFLLSFLINYMQPGWAKETSLRNIKNDLMSFLKE